MPLKLKLNPPRFKYGRGKPDDRRIPRLRQDDRARGPPGVGESQHLGAFIKRLSRGVIKGFSKESVFTALGDEIQVGMTLRKTTSTMQGVHKNQDISNHAEAICPSK